MRWDCLSISCSHPPSSLTALTHRTSQATVEKDKDDHRHYDAVRCDSEVSYNVRVVVESASRLLFERVTDEWTTLQEICCKETSEQRFHWSSS